MKNTLWFLLLLTACAPQKKEEASAPKVDNTVTRYTGALQTSVEKAHVAQQKANAAIAAEQEAARTAQSAAE